MGRWDLSASLHHLISRQSFFRGKPPFFLFQGIIVSEHVWREMKKLSEKKPVCPQCGSSEAWKFGSRDFSTMNYACKRCGAYYSEPWRPPQEGLRCPTCGSQRLQRNGHQYINSKEKIQRWLWNECGHIFYHGKTAVTIHLSRKKSKYNVIFGQYVGVAFQEESQTFPNHFLFLQGGLFLKDSSLSVVYRRGDNGQLFVWLYRGQLHIGTVEVNSFNCMKVIRGVANASPVLVKYLPAEALLEETL